MKCLKWFLIGFGAVVGGVAALLGCVTATMWVAAQVTSAMGWPDALGPVVWFGAIIVGFGTTVGVSLCRSHR